MNIQQKLKQQQQRQQENLKKIQQAQQEQADKKSKQKIKQVCENVEEVLEDFFQKDIDNFDSYLQQNPTFQKTYEQQLLKKYLFFHKVYNRFYLIQKDKLDEDKCGALPSEVNIKIVDFINDTFGYKICEYFYFDA